MGTDDEADRYLVVGVEVGVVIAAHREGHHRPARDRPGDLEAGGGDDAAARRTSTGTFTVRPMTCHDRVDSPTLASRPLPGGSGSSAPPAAVGEGVGTVALEVMSAVHHTWRYRCPWPTGS